MKMSDIKVGVTYGVIQSRRNAGFSSHLKDHMVPATVVELDVPYERRAGGRFSSSMTMERSGGVRVRFVKPTVVAHGDFTLLGRNDARETMEEYVFGSKKGQGPVGQLFLGVWSELEAERKKGEAARREYLAAQNEKAAAFAPELAEVRALFKAAGVNPDLIDTYDTEDGQPYQFKPDIVSYRFDFNMLRQLVEIAVRHNEKVVKS